jgi:hypothetical protein
MASPFLLDISRDMRLRGYSLQTEKTYLCYPPTRTTCLLYTCRPAGGSATCPDRRSGE